MLDRGKVRGHDAWRDWSGGLFMATACATAAASIGFKTMQVAGVFPQPPLEHISRATQVFIGTDTGKEYAAWLGLHPVRTAVYFSFPVAAAGLAGWAAWGFFGQVRPGYKHLRGRRLKKGKAATMAAKIESAKMVKATGEGLELFPGVWLSVAKLLQSLMICGAQGGGKTVIINNAMQSAFALNHKAIIFDPTKGDYSAWVPMSSEQLMLISLTDSRSLHWWLGYDIKDVHDATAFVAGLIPESSDPLWSNAARMVLVTCILSLIAEKGEEWSWPDLALRSTFSVTQLRGLAEKHYPVAQEVLNPTSKTSASIMINQAAFCGPLHLIAAQASKINKSKRISLTKWLNNDDTKHRRIVVQMNQRATDASSALARAIVELLTQRIASLEFPESKTRRLGFWLDENPQFGKLGCVSKLMEIGRSKGVYTVFGFQDYSQIEQIYGPIEAKKWMALFGTKAFPQVNGMASQKFVSDEIGQAEVQYRNHSVSGIGGGGAANISNSWGSPTSRPVILPTDLSLYGPRKDGIEALFIGIGPDCLALKIPFAHCPAIRPAHVPWSSTAPKTKLHRPMARKSSGGILPRIKRWMGYANEKKVLVTQHTPKQTQHSLSAPQAQAEDTHAKESTAEAAKIEVERQVQLIQEQLLQVTDAQQSIQAAAERQETADEIVSEEVAVNQVSEMAAEATGIPVIGIEALFEISGMTVTPSAASTTKKRRVKKSLVRAGLAAEQ